MKYYNIMNVNYLVTTHSFGCGTALCPKMPFKTAMHLPTITSSVTFSIMAAASPATSAKSTGAEYKFQNRNSSPENRDGHKIKD